MGSSLKNNTNYYNNSNNNNKAKPYALMLLLAFGAAILGVMVLHKLREKRIFGLLVKEKDHELLTLHLLFQREQEFNKDARKKIEEMKTKVYTLRSQKLELDRRLLEMESTIASLRDERKVIESSLEEKKNEIKMLTENGLNSTLPRVSALLDMIKMKETEIEHLKIRINKTEPNSGGARVESENESHLRVNDSLDKTTNETENLDGVDGSVASAAILNRVDENNERKTDNFRSFGVMNETVLKVNGKGSQENPQELDSRDLTRTRKNGLGIRIRRRHSRSVRPRTKEAGALSNLKENIESNDSRKEVGPLEVHQAKSENGVQSRDIGRDGLGSTEMESNSSNEAENANKDGSMSNEGNKNESEKTVVNATEIHDDINSGHDVDANRKLLKMQNIDVNKDKGDDEQGKETEVDGESESDDTEDIREPEIDRADIRRFAESDPDKEEAEEIAEESEF